MRTIIFLFLVFQTSNYALKAQKINSDSLWAIWNDETQTDTNRLKAMDDLTFKYYNNSLYQLDTTIYYAEKMLTFAKQKGQRKYEANALHNMAMAVTHQGEFEESIALNTQSLAIREEIGDKKGIGRSLANTGGVYRAMGDRFTGLIYYKRALKYFEEINDLGLISHALTYMGAIYSEMNDLPRAINCAGRSLEIAEKSGNDYFLTQSLLYLANLYQKALEYSKSREYAIRAKEIAIKTELRDNFLQSLYYISQAYSNEKEYETALVKCNETLSLLNDNDAQVHLIYTNGLIGSIYEKMGAYDEALKYHTICKNIMDSAAIEIDPLINDLSIGQLNRLKKEWPNAIMWCKKALEQAENQKNLGYQLQACQCLYESYKGLNDGNNALIYHERLLALKDSFQFEDAAKKLQQMEFQKKITADSVEQVEKDRLVNEAHQEEVRQKNQTRNMLLGGGLILLILAGGLILRVRYIRKSKAKLEEAHERSENLLLNILPADIAKELKEKGKADARDFDLVSILFTDFKSFTQASEKLTAADLVGEINACFEAFDAIMEKYGIEKIKTIGDAYMAAGGLPVPKDDSVKNTVLAAIEMQTFISKRKAEKESAGQPAFEMRAGIHTGPVVAGIVGVKKFQYDIWGDTVNTASRMESHGEVGKVNISQATYELLNDDTDFSFESRGMIDAKGKGEMEMFFVRIKNN